MCSGVCGENGFSVMRSVGFCMCESGFFVVWSVGLRVLKAFIQCYNQSNKWYWVGNIGQFCSTLHQSMLDPYSVTFVPNLEALEKRD